MPSSLDGGWREARGALSPQAHRPRPRRQTRPATTTGHLELGSYTSELAKEPGIEDVERLGVDRLDHQPGHLPERIDVIALVNHGDVVAREQSTRVDH
ncbi:MAG TPA: hypothetical protein VFT70_03665 [Nocardioides sp.]|nr:hypothetical protein [Nocardioides sp.]